MSEYLFENNAISTLNSSINDTDVSLFLQGGDGALFPAPGAGQIFTVTLVKSSGAKEIVECTNRTTDALTVVRGREGTTALSFDAGDIVSVRLTKGALDQYIQTDKANTFGKTQTWSKGADLINGDVSVGVLTLGTDGNYFDYAGTLDFSEIATVGVGTVIKIHFDNSVIVTHHATNMDLPTKANITTSSGDEWELIEYATGDWRVTNISLASGAAVKVTNKDYLNGLDISIDTDTDHDILFSTGEAFDSTNTSLLELTAAITKQIDASWVAGDDVGGLFLGVVGNATVYHLFIIEKDSDGSIDAGFDTSITAANIPSGYTKYVHVGYVWTDGSANIVTSTNATSINRGKIHEFSQEIPTTSGTAIDILFIPSWVTKITVMLVGVSTNGSAEAIIQLGDAGGLEITGYSGAAAGLDASPSVTNLSAGFNISDSGDAAHIYHGFFTLVREDSSDFTWVAGGNMGRSDATQIILMGGSKSLSAALTQLRLTTTNGTDIYDAGGANFLLE